MTVKTDHLWRNDITGLRALAVLPVLIYHAFPGLIPGGFFGVDVFFVISGYLISGIIFRALQKDAFSYRSFYEKRIKRILPNLLLLLAFVAVVGYFYLLGREYRNLGQHITASAAFFQNFRLLSEIGYFTEDALRTPLLHLWSLAIEEQFYIVFPILCTLIWRFSKSPKLIGLMVLAITVGSFCACLMVQDRSFNFYFPLTRFWELGCGIVLSYLESFDCFRTRRIDLKARHAMSITGLACVLVPMLVCNETMRHPGWITLLPVVGSVLMIMSHPDAVVNRTLLSCKPMTFVGLISYSLYLWHWPLLSFVYLSTTTAPVWVMAGALLLSFVLATLVYYFVENPVRISKGWGRLSTTSLLLIGLVCAVAFGQIVRKLEGLPNRWINQHYADVASIRDGADSWERFPSIRVGDRSIRVTDTREFPTVVFAGDSHAKSYDLRVKKLAEEAGVSVAFVANNGTWILSDKGDENQKKCAEDFYALLADERVKTVVLASKWGDYYEWEQFDEGIDRFKKLLRARPDVKVYVLLDAPWDEGVYGNQGTYDPYKYFYRLNSKPEDFIRPYPEMDLWSKGNKAITKALGDVATIISIEEYVCPNGKCDLLKWYRDDDHLQPRRLETDAAWLDPVHESIKR